MKKKIQTLSALISASLSTGLNADQDMNNENSGAAVFDMDNIINAQPLNRTVSYLLASHRSHSSHRSHRSHRSSSGGGYSRPSYTAPVYTKPKPKPKRKAKSTSSSSYGVYDPLGQQSRPAKSYPSKPKKTNVSVKKIIEKVQLALLLQGLYTGAIDGIMGPDTRKAILMFKKQNNITSKVLLGTETLNALGVKAF